MMDAKDIARDVQALQALLTAKFGVREQPLSRMLKRVGRRMPKRMHAKANLLIKAQHLAGHPKLARQMDGVAVSTAFEDVKAHLNDIDVAERNKGRALSIAGAVAFNVLLVVAAFVFWLWWRGYV